MVAGMVCGGGVMDVGICEWQGIRDSVVVLVVKGRVGWCVNVVCK